MITSTNPNNDIRVSKEGRAYLDKGYCVSMLFPTKLRFPKPFRFIWWQIKKYYRIEHSGDIIHCHDLNTMLLGILLKRKYGGYLIFDSHEYYLWLMWKFPEYIVYPYFRALQYVSQFYVDCLIVISNTMREYFEKRYKFKKIIVVRNTQ